MAKAKQIFGGQAGKQARPKPQVKGPESKKSALKVQTAIDLI